MQASTISYPVLHRHCLLFIHAAILIITFQEKNEVGKKRKKTFSFERNSKITEKERLQTHPTILPIILETRKKKIKGTEEEKHCLCATSQTTSKRKGSQAWGRSSFTPVGTSTFYLQANAKYCTY